MKKTEIEVIEGQKIEYFVNGNGERHYIASNPKQNAIIRDKILQNYRENYYFVRCGKEMRIVWFSKQSVGEGKGRKEWLSMTKMSRSGFLQAHSNDQWSMAKVVEGGKIDHELKNKAETWLNHPNLIIYRGGLVFKPAEYCQPDELNLWHGLNMKAKQGDWSLIRQHFLEVLCDNNEDYLHYLLDWLAHLYQKPFDKLGVAIVLRSPEKGTGKGTAIEIMTQPLMDYFLPINSAKQLTGQFNSHLDGKLFLFADEAVWGGDKKAEGALCTLITETLMPSEAKFEDISPMANYSRVAMATNFDWVAPVGQQERRFLVLNVSAHRASDKEYFKALREQAFENGGIEAMLDHLLQRTIDPNNLRKPPITEGLKQQYHHSKEIIEEYLIFCLEGGHLYYANHEKTFNNSPIWENLEQEIRKDFFYFGFCQYCRETNKRAKTPNQKQFGIKLKKLIHSVKDSRITTSTGRKTSYVLPTTDEAKKLISKQIGMDIFETLN